MGGAVDILRPRICPRPPPPLCPALIDIDPPVLLERPNNAPFGRISGALGRLRLASPCRSLVPLGRLALLVSSKSSFSPPPPTPLPILTPSPTPPTLVCLLVCLLLLVLLFITPQPALSSSSSGMMLDVRKLPARLSRKASRTCRRHDWDTFWAATTECIEVVRVASPPSPPLPPPPPHYPLEAGRMEAAAGEVSPGPCSPDSWRA